MSARRQASTTSLSKYARAGSPDFANRSLDFCNAFWGLGDGGVDVLFARMRGATRTMEELRNFWKERASIEEQYAKRLAALAKATLGRDEIGELRSSLETLRLETDKQASSHLLVAQQIKTDLEGQTTAFLAKQQQHKRTYQAPIEKEFKTKQTQESYVNKAREKYESDCMRINSYTAQSTLMQGKDLEKIQLKLERAQQTVQANERDYANFAHALQDTVQKWEQDWKMFCDSCQDLEEDRLEFMKDNMWAYANAVSTVCVSDDESCEKLRLSLEQLEPEKDMENFVRDYGTGNAIPDPPAFVNYANPDAVPPSSQRASTRPASFSRATQRVRLPPPQQPEPEEEPANMTGVGTGGGRRSEPAQDSQLQQAQIASRSGARAAQEATEASANQPNGHDIPARAPQSNAITMPSRAPDPQAEPIDPTAKTMLKVGDHAYEVDPRQDPQGRSGPVVSMNKVGQEGDPLAEQMNNLRNAAGGSVRRSGQWKAPSQQQQQQQQQQLQQSAPGGSGSARRDPSAKLSPPPGGSGSGTPSGHKYSDSAQMVVGAYPIQALSSSRPPSPNPITPAFMVPPAQNGSSISSVSVQDVVADYQQSLPGERKSISRAGSVAGAPPPAQLQNRRSLMLERPMSMEAGHAGVGAQGRSPSPQPFASVSRSASPAMQPAAPQPSSRNSYGRVPPPPANGAGAGPGHNAGRQGSMSVPQAPVQRPKSPNSVGIALDATGHVAHDDYTQMYQQQPPQQPPQQMQQQPAQQQYRQPPPQSQQPMQRRPSYNMGPNGMAPLQGQAQVPYGGASVPMYQQQYAHPPPPQQQIYAAPPPAQYAPPPQQQVYQPQPQGYPQGAGLVQSVQRGPSMNGYYPQGGAMVHPQQQQQQQQQPPPQQQQIGYRAPSPRAPSPQPPQNTNQYPTGAVTDDGRGVLFYVKALYNYQATIEEEFDFQEGDIIAVTATPEDGWWSGELLDEARRQPGRHIFPSNFVCLF